MASPTVSIVITNYNYAGFLPRSVGSALAQDYSGSVQVVVVDDASTDNSVAVISEFHKQITPVMKAVNGGHGAAFNSGFAASTGDLVLFLDADDYLYPQAVSTVVAALQLDAAQYQYRLDLVDGTGVKIDIYPPMETDLEYGDVKPQLLRQGRYSTTVTSGLAFPRWLLERILPMPPEDFRQGGDGYLVTIAPMYGSVVTVPGLLGAYCQHGGNHSQFALAIAKRARWRLFHDEMRYRALRAVAAMGGATLADEPGLANSIHLEERLASLQLEPALHPYVGDTPPQLAALGREAMVHLPISPKRRWALDLWWWLAGRAPRPMAKTIISWKMSAASRPQLISAVAKLARRSFQSKGKLT